VRNDGDLSVVTVVFERERSMLALQARSLDRYGTDVQRVFVVDNTKAGLSRTEADQVRGSFGGLADRVVVVASDDLAAVPPTDGWRRQQVLKLAASRMVETSHYLVLDAKSHLVRPLTAGSVVAPDGRARVNRMPFRQHALREALERSLRFYGLPVETYLDGYSATVPPFVLETEAVESMLTELVARSESPFPSAFLAADLTEFFAYTAFRLARGEALDDVYDFHQVPNPVIWARFAADDGVQRAVAAATAGPAPFFAIHRTAIARLSNTAVGLIAHLWAGCELFPDTHQAARWLRRERRNQRGWSLRAALHRGRGL
jgi:hypothetical protein